MGLVSFLSRRRRADVADLAIQVAVLSHKVIAELALSRARQMTPGEARGYVRARSREMINRQAELLFRQHSGFKPAEREHVIALALDQIVSLLMRDLTHAAPAARRKVA